MNALWGAGARILLNSGQVVCCVLLVLSVLRAIVSKGLLGQSCWFLAAGLSLSALQYVRQLRASVQ